MEQDFALYFLVAAQVVEHTEFFILFVLLRDFIIFLWPELARGPQHEGSAAFLHVSLAQLVVDRKLLVWGIGRDKRWTQVSPLPLATDLLHIVGAYLKFNV